MQIEQHWIIAQTVPYSEQTKLETTSTTKKQQNLKTGKVRFRLNIDVRKKMEDSRLNAIRQLITFVKFRLNFSSKSTIAANVHLTESVLDNWLKNSNITLDIKYNFCSQFVSLFLRILVSNSFPNRRKQNWNRILWQRAKIRPEWISLSNGSIAHPLGFVIDRLNTSASLYRIAPCSPQPRYIGSLRV